MACLPQLAAILRTSCPLERAATKLRRNLAEALRLLGHAGVATVEFEKQHRRLRQRELRIGVARPDLQRIEQLDASDRNAGLDGEDGGFAAGLDAREWADTSRNRLGDAGQPQRQLSDDSERAFRADDQPREVIAGR